MTVYERAVATALFSGYSRFAPGTCGSAVALLIYVFLPDLSPLTWVGLLAVVLVVSVPVSTKGERLWGPDPGPVVIDEVAGFFVSTAFLPQSLLLGIAAFFGFRVLEILKPPPARQAESLPGGWGIVLDDVAAGIYVNLILHGTLHLFGDDIAHLL